MSLEGLTDGLDVDIETMRDPRTYVQWDVLAEVIQRLAERAGGDDAYADLLADIVDHPDSKYARTLLRVAISPRRNYILVFRWASHFMFPFVDVTVDERPNGRIRVVHRIPEVHKGSRAFLLSAVSFARVLPRVHGLPDAQIEVVGEVTDRYVEFVARLPNQKPRFQRLRRWWAIVNDAPSVVEEVLRQSHELSASHQALERLYAQTTAREQQLAEQIRLKRVAEEALADRNRQLIQAQRLESLGRLAGGVAHDFNNLLTAILGQTELLAMQTQDAATREGLEHIRDAADRATALTRQLLTFAKRQPVARSAVDISALVTSLEPLLRRLLGDAHLELDADTENWVAADPVQLEQVLVNLVVNAGDAMGGAGVVRLRVHGQEQVVIEVSDTGEGMSVEVQDRIFEPFFTTKGQLGTGLGLAIVYGIVAEAGGRIDVTSSLGEGTTFRIEWPRLESLTRLEVVRSEPRLLVIDDEPALRKLMAALLRREGFVVDTAADGKEALALAHRGPYDLVVSDVMLERERGPSVVAELRQHLPDVRVLYVTGFGDQASLAGLAGERVLAKPFGAGALVQAVRELLAAHVSLSADT